MDLAVSQERRCDRGNALRRREAGQRGRALARSWDEAATEVAGALARSAVGQRGAGQQHPRTTICREGAQSHKVSIHDEGRPIRAHAYLWVRLKA